MQTENYYASQIKPEHYPRKYSYMNRARKYNRKVWLAERAGYDSSRLDELRVKYDQMAGFDFYY